MKPTDNTCLSHVIVYRRLATSAIPTQDIFSTHGTSNAVAAVSDVAGGTSTGAVTNPCAGVAAVGDVANSDAVTAPLLVSRQPWPA
jgi:hypothetical protein